MRDPDQSIGFLINDVTRLMRRNLNRRAATLGLSQAQWRALARLSVQEGVNQVTLADALEIQPITLARTVDRLEESGLVARRPDPEDRRAFRLYLTDDAQPLLARMWELAAETIGEATATFSDDDRDHLVDALRRMKRSLLDAECGADGSTEKKKKTANAAGNH